MKICAVYKITNTITGDFYIGSSKDVNKRWTEHKAPSSWKRFPNNPMYIDMKQYGVDKFVFEMIAEVEPALLKEKEQQFIETLKPTYNSINAKGLDVEWQKKYRQSEKFKECQKKYRQSEKFKECQKKYDKEYHKSEKFKECQKKYYKSDKGKESLRKAQSKYKNQLCFYNGEILTLSALAQRFQKAGIPHPTIEAKKYLLVKAKDK